MAIVLIVSKTRMKTGVCVGGIDESTCELVRLRNENGGNLSTDTPFQVGDRWELNIKPAWNARDAPHTEDKQITIISKIDNIGEYGIIEFINSHNLGTKLTDGPIEGIFEGCLKFQGTRNFVNRNKIPTFSTQFWIADEDLIHCKSYNTHYYFYKDIRLRFVGFQDIVDRIPAGTIIRLSLASWWSGDGSGEERCYLQLSGWYNPDIIATY